MYDYLECESSVVSQKTRTRLLTCFSFSDLLLSESPTRDGRKIMISVQLNPTGEGLKLSEVIQQIVC